MQLTHYSSLSIIRPLIIQTLGYLGTVGALSRVTTEFTRGCLIVVKLLPCIAAVDLTGAVGAATGTVTVGASSDGHEELSVGKVHKNQRDY